METRIKSHMSKLKKGFEVVLGSRTNSSGTTNETKTSIEERMQIPRPNGTTSFV